jgi:hypothetical protein
MGMAVGTRFPAVHADTFPAPSIVPYWFSDDGSVNEDWRRLRPSPLASSMALMRSMLGVSSTSTSHVTVLDNLRLEHPLEVFVMEVDAPIALTLIAMVAPLEDAFKASLRTGPASWITRIGKRAPVTVLPAVHADWVSGGRSLM